MLTQQSYMLALTVACIVALIALRLVAGWLPKHWPLAVRWALLAATGGVLMTPSFPSEDAATLAPALIIVVFNTVFGEGWSSAVTAFAHLLMTTLAATLTGASLGWWRGSHYPKEKPTRESV